MIEKKDSKNFLPIVYSSFSSPCCAGMGVEGNNYIPHPID